MVIAQMVVIETATQPGIGGTARMRMRMRMRRLFYLSSLVGQNSNQYEYILYATNVSGSKLYFMDIHKFSRVY